jgi:hypothetical protein
MMKQTMLALGSLALIATLTGCGGSSGDPEASPSLNAQDKGVKFAQCMRQHGIAMEDPKSGQMSTLKLTKANMAKTDAAMQACKEFSPVRDRVKMSPEELDKQIALAKCMRSHGVEMEDPKPDGGMQRAMEATPKTLKAHKICAKQVGLPDVGLGERGAAAPGAAVGK